MAKRIWPEGSAIGRVMKNGDRTLTVVGVAKDSKYRSLGESPRNFIYVPFSQWFMHRMTLMVRAKTPVSAQVRVIVADIDRALPILNQQSFEEHAATALFPQRLAVYVAASLGGVALLLALLGIYGVTAFNVAQRTREIGIRVAVGAKRSDVVGAVLRQGVGLAGIGIAIGAVFAFGLTQVLTSLLYGLPA